MAKANISDSEIDDEISNLPLSPSIVLRREKIRLEKSLHEIEKAISEIETHEECKMAEKVSLPNATDESSNQPFLGFTPIRSQSEVRASNASKAYQESIDAQGVEFSLPRSSVKLVSLPTEKSKVGLFTMGSTYETFDANATFSRGMGRGRRLTTPITQQVSRIQDSSASLGVQCDEMRQGAANRRFVTAIYNDNNTWSTQRKFDDQRDFENSFDSSAHIGGRTQDDNDGSIDLGLPNVPGKQSTGLLPHREFGISSIGNDYVEYGGHGLRHGLGSTKVELQYAHHRDSDNYRHRNVMGSTKVELLNAHTNRTDDNFQQRSVHFDPDEGHYGQNHSGYEQRRRDLEYDQVPKHTTVKPNYVHSTPKNFKHRQQATVPDIGQTGSFMNFNPYLCDPTVRKQNAIDNADIMTRLMARQVDGKELPIFSGDPQDWLLFESQYRRTTKTCHYSGEENIFRLRKCLRDPALTAVKSLLVSPDNAEAVMQILKRRFGRPEDIIKALVKQVKESETPREDKPKSIVIYATAIENLVATLNELRRDDHLRNPILLNELERKLPTTLSFLWSEYVVDRNDITLKIFSDWMQKRAEAASRRFNLDPIESEGSKKSDNKIKKFVSNVEKVTAAGACRICNGSCQKPWRCEVLLGKNVNQRWNLVKEKKLCFSCLAADHNSKDCSRPYQCGIDGCQRTHNKILHNKPQAENKRQNNITVATLRSTHRTNLRILPVIVSFNGREIKTFALLDNGSQSTLVSATLVKRLGIVGTTNPIILQWPNGDISSEDDSQIVNINIRGTFNGAENHVLINTQTVKKLNLLRQTINRQELVAKWPYLRDIEFESYENVCPEILIGENNCLLTATRELLHDVRNTPIASKTWLGWTISGNDGRQTPNTTPKTVNVISFTDDDLYNLVKSAFMNDDVGIKDQPIRSKEDVKAQKILDATTQKIGNRWQTGLLWRNPDVILPESRTNAYHRLLSLERKFDREPELYSKYETIINGYIEKKYLRKVSITEVNYQRVWYLPHFPVKYPLKPGKIRVVFDAAAKSHGTSLNDNLVTGPDLLKLLSGVLFRFRQGPIAFIGDIKEMFHRILIQESDVKCQKILWRGKERNKEPDEYEMPVMMFGSSCSPSSAIYIKNRNARQFEKEYPEAVNAIINKHYMDDYLDSKFSTEEAIKIIHEVIHIHSQGSFEICNWISSSKEVMAAIPEHLRRKSNSAVTLDHENLPGRVLGILWKPEEDVFTFSSNFARIDKELLNGSRSPSKREILKVVNSIYDPLGFVAHFVITGRIIMKNVWQCKIEWDEIVPEHIIKDWMSFLKCLKNIGDVQIDRCYSPNFPKCDNLQLHIFGDASHQAYCAIAFMRIQFGQQVEVKFITAKTRVTPLTDVTDDNIHRFELQAALLVSRLSKFVLAEHELNFDDCYYWTDSMVVWYWIHSETKRYKQFVANRLNEILELTETKRWKWLPGDMNVSDDGTRFGTVEFVNSNRWYAGPDFLFEDQSKWPEPKDKRISAEIEHKMEIINVGQVVNVIEFALPAVERFSKWQRLIGATAWMLRYVNNCNPNRNKISSGMLSLDEMTYAEMKWIHHSQQRSFATEISDLKRKKLVQLNSRIFNLSPEVDENGILRLYGRADRLPDSIIDQRRPIILDGNDRYVQLLIKHYHEKYNHIGHNTVLNEIKQRFWILKATVTLKKIRSDCCMCKVIKSRPQPTIMAQLPAPRLEGGNPVFHFTGVDYFGPIKIKIGRQIHKRYGALFTCLTTRAVHIEIAASESTDSFIMALRRFIARRGCPADIYSDNGSNLRGADNELKAVLQALDQDKIRGTMTTHRINWRFNPPTASHMGGSWERLVGSIKTALYATLNTVHPTEEMLSTLMAEAEHVVNSRPLLELSNDPSEPETLTPNHFLLGRSSASAPIGTFDSDDLILKKQWRASQHLADLFWKRWIKEYRPTLTKRTKWFRMGRNPRIGELVFLVDDQLPRGQWQRGIITNVFPGIDGQVRVVDVKTNKNTYRRPITKICLFDLVANSV